MGTQPTSSWATTTHVSTPRGTHKCLRGYAAPLRAVNVNQAPENNPAARSYTTHSLNVERGQCSTAKIENQATPADPGMSTAPSAVPAGMTAKNLAEAVKRVAAATQRAARTAKPPRLVAVSKTKPIEQLQV